MTLSPHANQQLLYVNDIDKSKAYYQMLFKTEPVYVGTRYVAFHIQGDCIFSIWNNGEAVPKGTPRFSEVGIMLKSNDQVEQLYDEWMNNPNIQIYQELITEVFGKTFLVKDPDGHILRVCPMEPQ